MREIIPGLVWIGKAIRFLARRAVKSIGKHFLCSAPEGLVWIAHDYGSDGRFEWVVLPMQLTNVSSYFNRMRTKPHLEFCGLYAGKSDGEGSPFTAIAVPYGMIVLPLTLISAFLLLSKPRKSTRKTITESTAKERGATS